MEKTIWWEEQNWRQPCQIYSRVCWWLVPRHSMNPGKRAERTDMKTYDFNVSMKHE